VQNVSTSHAYQLLEEGLLHFSEHEDAESNEDTAVAIHKMDVSSLSQMFEHCVEAKTNLDENYLIYERVFGC
jgi:hypothetical protein